MDSSISQQAILQMLRHTTLKAPISMSIVEELGLQHRGPEDLEELKKILGQILQYPSSQAAILHRDCNRLGTLDLDNSSTELSGEELESLGHSLKFCPCCGFIKQPYQIKLATSINEVSNIGLSTYLYFSTMLGLIYLLAVTTVVYSIYCIVTNAVASSKFEIAQFLDKSHQTTSNELAISLGSKQLNPTEENLFFYSVQAWLGFSMLLIWAVIFFLIKLFQKQEEIKLQKQSYSAADFTIMMEGVPQQLTHEQLQRQFSDYARQIHLENQGYTIRDFTIAKYNAGKPFYLQEDRFQDEELTEMNKSYGEKIKMFAEWIEERRDSDQFSTTKYERDLQYRQFEKLKKDRFEKYEKIVEVIKEDFQNEDKSPYTTVFVTFQTNYMKDIFLALNQRDFADTIRYYIKCCQDNTSFYLKDSRGNYIGCKVSQAPEPEDIIWTNLGRTECETIKNKLYTFTISFLLLIISFGLVYGLSAAQYSNQHNKTLSYAISLIISINNVVISQVLRVLTLEERDFTSTKMQTSLGLKAVGFSLLNSILIPILVNYYLEDNLYGPNGLASDVFTLSITTSFLAPVLKIVDPAYCFSRLMAYCYYQRPSAKLLLNQRELNSYIQYPQFQVGSEYVHMVNLFLFTCFFVSLQPIIAIFPMIGLTLLYWVQKYMVYSRCQRPIPGTNLVNKTMLQLILLGPLFYSIGVLCWSAFFAHNDSHPAFLPHIISLILSVVIFLFPYDGIVWVFFMHMDHEGEMKFQDYRIYLPSQYDRMNPATSKKAIQQFVAYIKQYKNQLKQSNNFKQAQKIFLKQMRFGVHHNRFDVLPTFWGRSAHERQNNKIINTIFGNQPIITPLLVSQAIIPSISNDLALMFGNNNKLNHDLIFRKVNSFIVQENQFQREDKNMLMQSGMIHGLMKHSSSDKYDVNEASLYQPTNAFSKLFHLQPPQQESTFDPPNQFRNRYPELEQKPQQQHFQHQHFPNQNYFAHPHNLHLHPSQGGSSWEGWNN